MKKYFLLFEELTNPETLSFSYFAAHGFCLKFSRNI